MVNMVLSLVRGSKIQTGYPRSQLHARASLKWTNTTEKLSWKRDVLKWEDEHKEAAKNRRRVAESLTDLVASLKQFTTTLAS
jgi:hypothetical protein